MTNHDYRATAVATTDLPQTDGGNARRLIARHGDTLRYSHHLKKWLVWDENRWRIDDTDEVVALAKETVRAMYAEAATIANQSDQHALVRHVERSESVARIRAMIQLAETEDGVRVRPEDLDADPWLLNCQNGIVDLRTGSLSPHDPSKLLTKLIPARYDPHQTRPERWDRFLDDIVGFPFCLDDEFKHFLQRAIGYTLTGVTSERVLFILHGTGANGKTVFQNAIAMLIGDYAANLRPESLLVSKFDSIPNDIARLKGARYVHTSETDRNRRLAEARVKLLTGGDKVSARFMRQEWFEYVPEFKLWLATNNKPTVSGTDRAIWDRIKLIPFQRRIAAESRRPQEELLEAFRDELDAILGWAVEGCLRWQQEGLGITEEVTRATAAYRGEMDIVGRFIEARCVMRVEARTRTSDMYKAFAAWCREEGEEVKNIKEFKKDMEAHGWSSKKTGGYPCWLRVALLDAPER